MIFHTPLAFILLPIVIFTVIFANKKKNASGIRFSSGALLAGLKSSLKLSLSENLFYLRLAALLLIVLALARPQSPIADSKIESEGIDIVLAIDASTSMLAEDFKIGGKRKNRLAVVKDVVKEFIEARADDRMGIVAFAARAYTVSPLTLDHNWLVENLDRVNTGLIEDGTAIGSGIASSLNRLRDTEAKSKIIILLTDGRNNAGKISPQTAAEAAGALKVKIYTIGAGSRGLVPYPVKDFFGRTVYQNIEIDLDEEALNKIASITEAKYFRATDTESLRNIYKEIDKMEKSKFEEKGYSEYKELFVYFLIAGLILLFLEIILGNTVLRKIP